MMRLRSLVLAGALLGLALPVRAAEMLIAADNDGCQTAAPFAFTELVPGGKWQATVDLSRCTSGELGWYRYYGYIAKNNTGGQLRSRDGIVLTVQNMSVGAVLTSTPTSRGDVYIRLNVNQPAMFSLTAENTGHSPVKIRLTWARESM